jgi:outer membrane protein
MNKILHLIFVFTNLSCLGMAEVMNLTLEATLQRASEMSQHVLLAKTGGRAAAAAKDLDKAPFYPHFSIGTGVAATYGFPLSIEGSAPSLFNVNFTQTLYDRKQRKQANSSTLREEGARIEVQSQEQNAALEAGRLFLELRNQRERCQYRQTQLVSLEKTREIVAIQVEAGVLQPRELTKSKLEVAKAKVALTSDEKSMLLLEEQLKQSIGVSADVSLLLGDDKVEGGPAGMSEETMVAAALDKDPTLRHLRLQSKSYEMAEEGLHGWFRPVVNLVGRYDVFSKFNNYDNYFQNFQRNNALLGFSIQVPLIMPELNPEKRRLMASRDETRLKIKMRTDQIRMETQREMANLAVLKAKEEMAGLEAQLARENLQAGQANYEEGKIPLADLEELRREESARWIQYLDVKLEQEKNQLNMRKQAGLLLRQDQ